MSGKVRICDRCDKTMWSGSKFDAKVCDECFTEPSDETKTACYEIANALKFAAGEEWPAPSRGEIEKAVEGLARAIIGDVLLKLAEQRSK